MENNYENIYAFAEGKTVPLNKVSDEVFASYTLGKGIAIMPKGDTLYAPCDATVSTIADTSHAVSITTPGGAELLLHVGIDTVNLRGTFFDVKVVPGKKVKRGDKLIVFQREKIEYEGYDTTICMVVCNTSEYKELKVTAPEDVTTKDIVMQIAR